MARASPFRATTRPPRLQRSVGCGGLKENVAALPPITGIRRVLLPTVSHTIDNVEGKKASVAIYSYLAQQYGGRLDRCGRRAAVGARAGGWANM